MQTESDPNSRGARRIAKRRRTLTCIIALGVSLVAVGGFLLFQHPLIQNLLAPNTATVEASEIDLLVSETPLLFTDSWGGKDPDKLRAQLERYNSDLDLLATEARRRGIEGSEELAAQSLGAFKATFANPDELARMLDDRGISEQQLASYFERTVLVAQLSRELVKEGDISDKELLEYYQSNLDRYASTDTIRISQIVFGKDDLQTANEVYGQLQSGADFAQMAARYSLDRSSKDRGGDLGWANLEVYPDQFASALSTLKVGETSPPVVTKAGIHLIRLDEVRTGSADLTAVKDQVLGDLLAKRRGQAIERLLDGLRAGRS